MMKMVRSSCPRCGVVDMEPDVISLFVEEKEYQFPCPICEDTVVKQADENIITLLLGAGVKPTEPPAHPEQIPGGSPLTYDDLLDFHLLLEREHPVTSIERLE